jgi:hypothetical protein
VKHLGIIFLLALAACDARPRRTSHAGANGASVEKLNKLNVDANDTKTDGAGEKNAFSTRLDREIDGGDNPEFHSKAYLTERTFQEYLRSKDLQSNPDFYSVSVIDSIPNSICRRIPGGLKAERARFEIEKKDKADRLLTSEITDALNVLDEIDLAYIKEGIASDLKKKAGTVDNASGGAIRALPSGEGYVARKEDQYEVVINLKSVPQQLLLFELARTGNGCSAEANKNLRCAIPGGVIPSENEIINEIHVMDYLRSDRRICIDPKTQSCKKPTLTDAEVREAANEIFEQWVNDQEKRLKVCEDWEANLPPGTVIPYPEGKKIEKGISN